MKIYGDDTTEMPIDVNLWWWESLKYPQIKVYGGESTEMPIDDNIWW